MIMKKKLNEEHRYWIQLAAMSQIVLGSFLTLEHIVTWGGADPAFGHEWYGLLLFITGIATALFSRKKKDDK
jgi:hypothetical protein